MKSKSPKKFQEASGLVPKKVILGKFQVDKSKATKLIQQQQNKTK